MTKFASEQPQDAAALSPIKRAFLALEQAEARIAAFEDAAHEPIAVIGIGCRLPGADGPGALWRLLAEGRDAVGPIPPDRFDIDLFYDTDTEIPGRIAVREAGFLQGGVDGFDAAFFGISPREARGMDPQQRLMLEVAWEALEHAGQAPDRLSGSATGVFVGQANSDYATMVHKTGDPALLDAHFTSGIAQSVTSGRLSYLLGLQGPSLTVDTACSSSLVAVHLACQALRASECRMALAGGVNLMLSEDLFIAFSHSRMLAPDGRCKTFDAAADGFGRAEGCGVVVLKRLSDAREDGDRILAVIRGSAVNQDGPSSGLTAPNGPAQEAVIKDALKRAGLTPADIDYVEAHGTGTQLGDPLEVQALGHVFGPGRDGAHPLVIGSIKTNVGHLEAAAGVAGLIKLVLTLQHGAIPPHLHFHTPSPHIEWDEFPLRVPTTLQPWATTSNPRRGGVSSFGYSGTNAHVVVEEAPTASARAAAERSRPMLYTLSARTASALRELARRHRDAVDLAGNATLAQLCRTANAGRAQFAHRATIIVTNTAELRERLDALATGREMPGLLSAHVQRRDPPRIAFVFTGQGAQYSGMARDLYEAMPPFRAALDRCARAIDPHLGQPLLELLFDDEARRLDNTAVTQPALFAVGHALAETWRAYGVAPTVVLGHSVGEIAAACVAGVWSLEDAARLVCERGRRMGALPAGGAMAAVHAPEDLVVRLLAGHSRVAIAAVNTPTQTVVSGAADAVAALCREFEAQGVSCQQLKVSHAFHSPLMEPMLDDFEKMLQGLTASAPRMRLISNLDGALATAESATQTRYWRRHVREPVRFADGVTTLLAHKPDVCVEIGPHPALLAFVASVAPDLPLVASMRKGRPDTDNILEALASLYLEGAPIDWRAVHEGETGTPVGWPTYPFERERCWFAARPVAPPAPPGTHVLLGARLRCAAEQQIYESRHITADVLPWVVQHRVHGRVVLPATAWLDMLMAAATDLHGSPAVCLEDVTIQQALLIDAEPAASRFLQTLIDPPDGDASTVRVASLAADADNAQPWTTHATARIPTAVTAPISAMTLDQAQASCPEPVDRTGFYDVLTTRGLEFGPAFQSIKRLWRGQGQALGEVVLDPALESERGRWHMHPVQLDGCLQLVAAALARDSDDSLFLPLSVGRYHLAARPLGTCWAYAVVADTQGETRRADVHVFNEGGMPVAQLLDVRMKRVQPETLALLGERRIASLMHEIVWLEQKLSPRVPLPTAGELAKVARSAIDRLSHRAGIAAYNAALPALDRLCAEYAAQALARLGAPLSVGSSIDIDGLADRIGVVPRHQKLLDRLLAILVQQGWLRREQNRLHILRDLSGAKPQPGEAVFGVCAHERDLTARTGAGLADALRGAVDPLQLLFPDGDTATAERVYRDASPAQLFNGLVGELVASAAQGRDATRPLRILEVGAGTGGTTAHVLPLLPTGSARYTFTDIGHAFVKQARERFGPTHDFMEFRVFDLELDAGAQGLTDGTHDLILASNVVHATRDLRTSLRRLRGLLAPGGVLVLLEACAPQAWFDITVGLTEGWWAFEDHDLRPDYPTLPRNAWLRLLRDCGFAPCEAVGGDPSEAGVLGLNTLLIAQLDEQPRHWLLVGDEHGSAAAIASRLRAGGDQCAIVEPGTAIPEAPAPERRWHGIVHAAALDAPADAERISLDALRVVQALVALSAPPRVWFLTRGAQTTSPIDSVRSPEAATLWGLARSLRIEHPELGVTCIDLDPSTPIEASADALLSELNEVGRDLDRALRGDVRRVARLVNAARPPVSASTLPAAWRLVPAQPGSFEAFIRQPMARRAPGHGEVEIAIEASGLNFKDLLNVLNLYPGEAGPLGAECAGRVVAVGAGVSDLNIGDRVLALAGGSIASHVVAPATFVRRLPSGIGPDEGASFAVAHLTAEFCLEHLAQLRAGQTVLVHAGAGGVGLAALRIAQLAGAKVYATAGSEWKREMLRDLGATQVFDSRSATFLSGVLAATGGRGVDVVLNSLSGELIEPSFAALADGGCFVEIGKRGIKTLEWVRSLGRNLRYHIVDWGETAEREPALIGSMLARLVDRLADGTLAPLPRHGFSLADASRAFRFMAQARHAGRIVLRHAQATAWQPSPRGTYLVTGGLSGLGLEVARWLGERGAGRLVLLGRRGITAEAVPVVEALRARGITVVTEALDISDETALRTLLGRLRDSGPPLRGVWHSAGILDAAALPQQNAHRFANVFAPKVRGAQLLDRLTRADPLDCFVLFSSIAGVLGSAGQANHAAAAAFLDALAFDRAARALPALAIDWGAWDEVGAATRDGTGERLATKGLTGLTTVQGLSAMERLLEQGATQAAVLAIRWPVYLSQVAGTAGNAFFDELARPMTPVISAAKGTDVVDLLAQIEGAPEARRTVLLGAFVREQALRVLGLNSGHKLDPRVPLGELGLDSLLAVELRNKLAAGLKRTLPATLLFDYPTVETLTDHLAGDILKIVADRATNSQMPTKPSQRSLDSIEDMSDEEVDRMLANRSQKKA